MKFSKFIFICLTVVTVLSSNLFSQVDSSVNELFKTVKIIYGNPFPVIGLNSWLMDQFIKMDSPDPKIQRYIMKFEDLQEKIKDFRLENKKGLELADEIEIDLSKRFTVKERNILNAYACRNGFLNPKEFFEETILTTNQNILLDVNKCHSFFRDVYFIRTVPQTEKVFKVKFLVERKEYDSIAGEWYKSEILKSFPDT